MHYLKAIMPTVVMACLLAVPAGNAQAKGKTVIDVRTEAGQSVSDVPVRLQNLFTGRVVAKRTGKSGRVSIPDLRPGNYCLSIGLSGAAHAEPECCAYRKLGYRDATVRFEDNWLCDGPRESALLSERAQWAAQRGDRQTYQPVIEHLQNSYTQNSRALIELASIYDETWTYLMGQLSSETRNALEADLRRAAPGSGAEVLEDYIERLSKVTTPAAWKIRTDRVRAPRESGAVTDGEGRGGVAANGIDGSKLDPLNLPDGDLSGIAPYTDAGRSPTALPTGTYDPTAVGRTLGNLFGVPLGSLFVQTLPDGSSIATQTERTPAGNARFKVAENNSPIPQDRLYYNYAYCSSLTPGGALPYIALFLRQLAVVAVVNPELFYMTLLAVLYRAKLANQIALLAASSGLKRLQLVMLELYALLLIYGGPGYVLIPGGEGGGLGGLGGQGSSN